MSLCAQMVAEENHMRQELQMVLDSKDSDIEQLRCQLTSLSVHSLDTTSISSSNDLDITDGFPGRPSLTAPQYIFLISCIIKYLKTLQHAFLFFCDFVPLLFQLFSFSSPHPCFRAPAQCALLTLAPLSQCPSPTSARTNPSALIPGPTLALLVLCLTLRMRKTRTSLRSRASSLWL